MEQTEQAVNLNVLTRQAQHKLLDRRGFIKGAVALGLSVSAAMILFQACGGGESVVAPTTAAAPAAGAAPAAVAAPAAAAGAAPAAVAAPAAAAGAAAPVARATENLDYLVRRLPVFATMPADMEDAWGVLDGQRVIYIAASLAHPFDASSSKTFKRDFEDRLGMEYTVLDSARDWATEAKNLDQAIDGNYDAIIYHPSQPAAGSDHILRARRAGQIVLTYGDDTLLRPTWRWGRPGYQEGLLTGLWMGQQLGSGAKVVGAVGDLVSQLGMARKAGFLEGASQSGLEVLAFEEGTGWTQDGGFTVGQTLLSNFPSIDGMFGGDDEGALGFVKAAGAAGRRAGMLITGADGIGAAEVAIGDGSLDMSVMTEHGIGFEAVAVTDTIETMLRGIIHGDALEASHSMFVHVVTSANLAEQITNSLIPEVPGIPVFDWRV